MSFEPRLHKPDDEPDEALELPDDLAELAEQLGSDAAYLAARYPAGAQHVLRAATAAPDRAAAHAADPDPAAEREGLQAFGESADRYFRRLTDRAADGPSSADRPALGMYRREQRMASRHGAWRSGAPQAGHRAAGDWQASDWAATAWRDGHAAANDYDFGRRLIRGCAAAVLLMGVGIWGGRLWSAWHKLPEAAQRPTASHVAAPVLDAATPPATRALAGELRAADAATGAEVPFRWLSAGEQEGVLDLLEEQAPDEAEISI